MNQTEYPSIAAYLKGEKTTQSELAKRVRCSQEYISRVINGLRMPRPALAIRISKATGVPLENLVVNFEKSRRKPRKKAA